MNRYYDVLYFNRLQEIVQNQVELTAINLQKTEGLIELGLKAESNLLEMKRNRQVSSITSSWHETNTIKHCSPEKPDELPS